MRHEGDDVPASHALGPLFWIGILGTAAVFTLSGLPFVFNDDAYMALPAIEFAAGRGLAAPALAAQFPEFHTNFLVYPPGFTVGLAGWVVIFGHATLSLSIFAMLSGLACNGLLFLVLHRAAPATPLRWVAPLIAWPACIYQGMRPELIGYPLFLLACWLLLARPGGPSRLAAACLLGLATLCAPTLFGPALLVLAFDLVRLRGTGTVHALLAMGAGGLLAFLALLWMIDGRLPELLRQFTQHALERRTAPGWTIILAAYIALLAASGVVLLLARLMRAPWGGLDVLIAWLAVALVLALVTHARQTLSVSLTNLLILALPWRAALLLPAPRLARGAGGFAVAGFAGLLLLANGYVLSMARHQHFTAVDAARLDAFIRATPPGDRLVLSPLLFRTALGGQWPDGALDLYFLRHWREGHIPDGMADFQPHDRVAMTDIDIRTIIAQAALPEVVPGAYLAPLRDGSGATEGQRLSLALRLTVPVLHGLPPRLPLRLCLLPRPDPALAAMPAAAAATRACGAAT